tara:strand:- start:997 stop:2142 length:1146 start_codon:yes stop_codon:yes gene_type:complete
MGDISNKLSAIGRGDEMYKQARFGLQSKLDEDDMSQANLDVGKDTGMSQLLIGGGIGLNPVFKYFGGKAKKAGLKQLNKSAKVLFERFKNKVNPADKTSSEIDSMDDGGVNSALDDVNTRVSKLPLKQQIKVNADMNNVKAPTDDLAGKKVQLQNKQKVVSEAEMKDPDTRSNIREGEYEDLNKESRLIPVNKNEPFNNPSADGADVSRVRPTPSSRPMEAGDLMEGAVDTLEKPAGKILNGLKNAGVDVPEGFQAKDLSEKLVTDAIGDEGGKLAENLVSKLGGEAGSLIGEGASIGGRVLGALGVLGDIAGPAMDIFGLYESIKGQIDAEKKQDALNKDVQSTLLQEKDLLVKPEFSMGSMAMPTMDTSQMRSGGMMNF